MCIFHIRKRKQVRKKASNKRSPCFVLEHTADRSMVLVQFVHALGRTDEIGVVVREAIRNGTRLERLTVIDTVGKHCEVGRYLYVPKCGEIHFNLSS